MPLDESPTDKAKSENIATEIKSGKPRKQAIAIGYAVQRRAEGKREDSTRKETRR